MSDTQDTKLLLAIDLGASGGKMFAGRLGGDVFRMEEIHRFEHEAASFFLPDSSGAVRERSCWDDTAIYREILRGLRLFRRHVGDRLDALGVDTWGADAQWVDADGEALGKVYCYRDHRLDNMVEEVRARISADRLYRLTGIHFQPFNLSNQVLWFATRRPRLLAAAAKLLPMPTLFNYYLGGCTQVDSTWASVTQMMDARRRVWSRPILAALGIPRRVLPAIVPPGSRVGLLQPALAQSLGLNRAAIVAVASHDTASAFAAAPADDPRDALIVSSGTWSLVGRLIPRPVTSAAAMAANISNEGGIGNTRFLKNCMGAWIVQELLRVWEAADGRRMSWEEVDRLTPAAPPFAGLIDPDDARFYNPADMEIAIRDFLAATGQPPPAGRGAILRLVYESLALKYRLVSEQLAAVIGRPPTVVHIVGGGSGNRLLNQFVADALGLPVLAGPREATAVGNLMVQALGIGLLPDLAAARPFVRAAFPIVRHDPGDRAPWEAAYRVFRERIAVAPPVCAAVAAAPAAGGGKRRRGGAGRALLLAAACGLFFPLVGCGRSVAALDAADRRHPAMRQALACEQAGDLDGAIARYEEVLMTAPRLASAHLALAVLLHDHRKDYVGAIYHYRRYLEARPEAEKATMISNRLQVAEQLLAVQSVRRLAAGDVGGETLLVRQIDTLNQRLAAAEAEKARLAEERDRLERQVKDLQSQVARLQRWVDRLQLSADVPVDIGRPGRIAVREPAAAERPRTYEVKEGDSLSRIAALYYGDEAQWPRIRDANRDKVRDGERVRAGDILTIP